jgi:hypothetical protein
VVDKISSYVNPNTFRWDRIAISDESVAAEDVAAEDVAAEDVAAEAHGQETVKIAESLSDF